MYALNGFWSVTLNIISAARTVQTLVFNSNSAALPVFPLSPLY